MGDAPGPRGLARRARRRTSCVYVVDVLAPRPRCRSEDFLSVGRRRFPPLAAPTRWSPMSATWSSRAGSSTGVLDTSLAGGSCCACWTRRTTSSSTPGWIWLRRRGGAGPRADPAPPRDALGARRLYVAVRSPDTLLIVDVQGIERESATPPHRGGRGAPAGRPHPGDAGVSRAERAASWWWSPAATPGVVAIYDPDVGQVVAQVTVGEYERHADAPALRARRAAAGQWGAHLRQQLRRRAHLGDRHRGPQQPAAGPAGGPAGCPAGRGPVAQCQEEQL